MRNPRPLHGDFLRRCLLSAKGVKAQNQLPDLIDLDEAAVSRLIRGHSNYEDYEPKLWKHTFKASEAPAEISTYRSELRATVRYLERLEGQVGVELEQGMPARAQTFLRQLHFIDENGAATSLLIDRKVTQRAEVGNPGSNVSRNVVHQPNEVKQTNEALAFTATKRADRIADFQQDLTQDAEHHTVVDDFEAFVQSNTCGYWLLTGGPGMGKSVIMAMLSTREWTDAVVVSFVFRYLDRSLSRNNLDTMYDHIIARLMTAFDISFDKYERSNDPAKLLGDLLSKSETGTKSDNSKRILIFIDGIDEMSGYDEIDEPLPLSIGLPEYLDSHVYVGMSLRYRADRRPVDSVFSCPPPSRHVDLMSNSGLAAQIETATQYIHRTAKSREYIKDYHSRDGHPTTIAEQDAFAARFAEKAGYNMMLIRCYLHERHYWIGGGSLSALTDDLEKYFRDHMSRMVGEQRFYSVKSKALTCLSILPRISKGLFAKLLSDLTNDNGLENAGKAIDEWCNQGLVLEDNEYGITWYRVYHNSYAEFLERQFKASNPAQTAREFLPSLINERDLDVTIADINRLTAIEAKEWLQTTLKLCLFALRYDVIAQLLTRLDVWRMASHHGGGIEDIVEQIGTIPVQDEKSRADARASLHEIATHVKKWVGQSVLIHKDNQICSAEQFKKWCRHYGDPWLPGAHVSFAEIVIEKFSDEQ